MAEFQLMELDELIDDFEERVWDDEAVRGVSTGSKLLDQGLEGLQPGWHVMAGDSNIGKSAFLTWLETNILRLNEDAFVLSLSLDDPEKEKLARVIASMGRVVINAVRRPKAYEHQPGMLERREKAIEELRQYSDRYLIAGSNTITPRGPACDIDAIEWLIQQTKIKLEEEALKTGKMKKLIVIVDNFHDTTTTDPKLGRDESKYEAFASRYADMAIKYNIAIVTTAEFRKLNGYRRPTVDDIRDSAKIKYEAKSIWLCYNEVSLRQEGASIYYHVDGNPMKQPVYELHVAKNKFGSFKGRIFYLFYPTLAWFKEADADTQKKFIAMLNSGE